MSILGAIRKGFSFFLMSMGVSTYAKKAAPADAGAETPAKPK
jgi:hypothetical protein